MGKNYKRYTVVLIISFLVLPLLGCNSEPPAYLVRVQRNVMVPMSDGVMLTNDIYFPVGLETAPAILLRSPYDKDMQKATSESSFARTFAKKGYIVVNQRVRGRAGSGGDFYPFLNDPQDGRDTIAWIEQQPWFNGKLSTFGVSYSGITQFLESASQNIDAMYLSFATANLKEVFYTGGELHLLSVFNWAMLMGDGNQMNRKALLNLNTFSNYMTTLPIDQADDSAGDDIGYFNDVVNMDKIFKMLQEINFEDKYVQISAPAITVAGWFDMFLGPQLKDFEIMQKVTIDDAKKWILIVGPWGHGPSGDGSIDFGDTGGMEYIFGDALTEQWFDYWLKGIDTGIAAQPRVKIFVMGENKWREENEWPLARTAYTSFYLHSNGHANTRSGDGVLSVELPAASEPPDFFQYDPLNPVPTRGGNNFITNVGPYDQSTIEDRQDVLCFSSPVLDEDIEVTGPVTAVLYAATDAIDTDFTVKLVDLYPDGRAINIQDGIVRAGYRNNDPDVPTPLTPGSVEEYHLDLWATSNLFKTGHRIRVEVSSSNFPRFNRNLNTGEPVTGATATVLASQSIYHTLAYPSHVVLPIIPRR